MRRISGILCDRSCCLHLYIKERPERLFYLPEIAVARVSLAAAMITFMTQLEVQYRYEQHPTEAAMFALGKTREVYGIRHLKMDQVGKTILVEYDATRLTKPIVAELLRRAGLDIVEELSLISPQSVADEPVAAAAPVK
jgi:hypothetical protein